MFNVPKVSSWVGTSGTLVPKFGWPMDYLRTHEEHTFPPHTHTHTHAHTHTHTHTHDVHAQVFFEILLRIKLLRTLRLSIPSLLKP